MYLKLGKVTSGELVLILNTITLTPRITTHQSQDSKFPRVINFTG